MKKQKNDQIENDPLDQYREAAVELSMALDAVKTLSGKHVQLRAEAERITGKREEILEEAITGAPEESVEKLSKLNAYKEVFAAKLTHLKGSVEKAELELQAALVTDFAPAFSRLYRELRQHRVEVAKKRLDSVIHPERLHNVTTLIDRLAYQAEAVVELEAIEPVIAYGCSTPLHDVNDIPHSQNHDQTLAIIMTSAEQVLAKVEPLLKAVAGEKEFVPPELVAANPEPVGQVIEPEPALA
jgi:hypothetical protein